MNTIGLTYFDVSENLSPYDIRMRNKSYISPEQIEMGTELETIS